MFKVSHLVKMKMLFIYNIITSKLPALIYLRNKLLLKQKIPGPLS